MAQIAVKSLVALGMTVALWGVAKAQSTGDLAGIWSCPNFTVTIRAEGTTYLIHVTPHRGLREYNVFGPFIDGQLQQTNSQLGQIAYVSLTNELIFNGEKCKK